MEFRETLIGAFKGLVQRWLYIFLPQPKVCYLIISSGRSGSNLLVSLLTSHPDVHSQGEVIGESQLRRKRMCTLISVCGPVRYVRNCYRKYFYKKAVGTKVLYYQFGKPYADRWHIKKLETVLDHILADKTIRILHLKRRNRLKTLASKKLAMLTKEYVNYHPDKKTQQVRVEISPQECDDFFNEMERTEQEFDGIFKDHDKLEVFYEDLVSDKEKTCAAVLDFLQLPQRSLETKTRKQNPKSLSERIENYSVLKEHFSNTQWQIYFED